MNKHDGNEREPSPLKYIGKENDKVRLWLSMKQYDDDYLESSLVVVPQERNKQSGEVRL